MVCINCRTEMPDQLKGTSHCLITNGICNACISTLFGSAGETQRRFLDSFDAPILLMQPEPRRARTANKSACGLFGKDLSQIEGSRGGEVFNCEYAFTESGCGLDEHCQDCVIRNTMVETFKTGRSFTGASTILTIKHDDGIHPYSMTITTENIGKLALVRIDQFLKIRKG